MTLNNYSNLTKTVDVIRQLQFGIWTDILMAGETGDYTANRTNHQSVGLKTAGHLVNTA